MTEQEKQIEKWFDKYIEKEKELEKMTQISHLKDLRMTLVKGENVQLRAEIKELKKHV